MSFVAALFDLDGTLLNTIPDLADAANAMRLKMGLSALPQDVIATYVGKGTKHLVIRALTQQTSTPPDPQHIEDGLALFAHHYHLINGDKASVYPGVFEGLNAFKEMGIKLAVVTNKPTEFTLPLLDRTGLAHFFDHVVCGDTCAERKPHPMPFLHACALLQVDPSQTLAVGDSIYDAQAARAANITVLAVPYGYSGGQDVQNLNVDDIVTSIEAAARWAAQH